MSNGLKLEVFRGEKEPIRSNNFVGNGVIKIDKSLCEEIENAHYSYNSSANVEKMFIDSHKNDVNGNVLSSAVFKEYHKQTVEAMRTYEELKNELVDRYDLYDYDWRLDFKNCRVLLD